MNVLIGCEESGKVCAAFRAAGHDAWSNDLLPTRGDPRYHIRGDVHKAIKSRAWDLGIFFPPCTFLTVSANRWQHDHWVKRKQGNRWHDGAAHRQGRADAYEFFMSLWNCDIPKVAIENPIGVMSTLWRKPDQIIQPWMFGHGETKATCLWLKNLPRLVPTDIVGGREGRVWKMPPGPLRQQMRSETYSGIATAMAEQWG